MAASVPPKAVGSILADRAVADADAFEKFAEHYMSIILSKKKCNRKLLQRTGIRRSERLIAKRKIIDENVCKKKIKTKNPPSNLKTKRRINFNKIRITPPENIIQISDDDDMEIIESVPEPAAARDAITIDCNNNQEMAAVPIEVDSSSDEENDQDEWKASQLIENDRGRQDFHSGGCSSNEMEDNYFHNRYSQNLYETNPYYLPNHQTIEPDMTSSSSIRSTSTTIGYYSHSHITPSHNAYIPNREPFTPIGGMPNCYQEMPMTGAAPYSNLYSYNESQQRMTPSTPLPLLIPEQASHSFAEELPTNSAHCVFQVNQLTALTSINDRPSRTGIFSIFFGNNQHAYISGHMFFNSEDDNFQFEEHFFNQSHMSNDVPNQSYERNYDSQHPRVNQPQSNQLSAHEHEQPVNDEDESTTINNSTSNNTQRGQCNMERFLSPRNVQSDSKYETIEILDSSDDECEDDTVSEMTFPAARAASDNPRLNLMSFMAMVSNGELSLTVAERGRIDALRPDPTNANIRIRIDLQENGIDDHFSVTTPTSRQSDSRSLQWHEFPTVTYNVLYGPNPGEEAIMFNSVLFINENQQCFYRYIPWLLGLWHQRNFISWVVDFEEIP